MSRAQQGQTFDTAQQENQTYNTNAQTAFNQAQTDIGNYQNQLAQFAAANPYGQGGQFQTTENQVAANTADAAAQAAGQAMQGAAVRTGENAGGGIAATEATEQANERNLSAQEAQANQQRIAAGANYGQTVLNATGAAEGMQDTLAQQQAAAAQGALGTQEQAAQTPSFMDELGAGLIQAGAGFASAYGGAMCPAEGSIYLMADGNEERVENLKVGDQVRGIEGDPLTIEEIQSAVSPVLRITTDGGHVLRCSRVHAFALPAGGFAVASKALGKVIVTGGGSGRIVSVEDDGMARVFNVITDGSHTYRANGMWSLGVGEAERQISMERWNEIGSHMNLLGTEAAYVD